MNEIFDTAKEKMEKSVESLEKEFGAIRAGRANPAVLDKIKVEYYGTETPINQVAAISVPEARCLVIQPWDVSIIKQIEKAINVSDIGINPQNDGKVIRLLFPALTEDRRVEIAKSLSKFSEEAKVAVRSIRRDAVDKIKALKKKSEITEDELKVGEKKIQDLTDKYCDTVDKVTEKKKKEILEL